MISSKRQFFIKKKRAISEKRNNETIYLGKIKNDEVG
jgi:hypothetical protein